MKTLLHSAIAAVLLTVSGITGAAETSPAVQVFTCNFKEGVTMDHFWDRADRFRRAMSEIQSPGLDTIDVFALMPFRSSANVDLLWLVASPNLNAMGQGLTDYYASEAGRGADAAFAEIADCTSGVALIENVRQAPEGEINAADRDADGTFEVFGCNLLPGKDGNDLDSAVEFWQKQVAKIDSDALDQYGAWLWRPFRASSQFDFIWFGASPDLVTSMQGATDYYTSSAGQAADERFASMSKCSSGLWTGYAIHRRNADTL